MVRERIRKWYIEVEKQKKCLSQISDCLEKLINGQSDVPYILEELQNYDQEFLGIKPGDTEKTCSISAYHTDPKKFVENIPLVLKEMQAKYEEKKNEIEHLHEMILRSHNHSLMNTFQMCLKQIRMTMVEFSQKLEEVETKMQKLIQTFQKNQENKKLNEHVKELEDGNQNLQKEKKILQEKNEKLIDQVEELKEENLNLQKGKKIYEEKLGIDNSRETETAAAMEMQKRNVSSGLIMDLSKEVYVETRSVQVTEDDAGKVVPSGH